MTGIVNGPIPDDFMKDIKKRLSSAIFPSDDEPFQVLDQLLLPHEVKYITVNNSEDAFTVIKNMQVRGAPLIAIVGIRGFLLDLIRFGPGQKELLLDLVRTKTDYLISSRPTAINLKNALELVKKTAENAGTSEEIFDKVKAAVLKIYYDEQEENRRLIWNGYQEIISLRDPAHKFTVMTVCNTGSLATVSWGTALGVIRALHEAGRLKMVYALETRPYNQGIRLTASELQHGEVPFTVITDNMAAWAMKTKEVDAVLVPFTTINVNRQTGEAIPIEERPPHELLSINGTFIGHPSTPVWNPAFDVTPGALISKVITDFGNFYPKDLARAVESVAQQ